MRPARSGRLVIFVLLKYNLLIPVKSVIIEASTIGFSLIFNYYRLVNPLISSILSISFSS